MVTNEYVPDRGDVMWADLHPTVGHEESGRRPVVVLTPRSYNNITGMAVGCPVTKQRKKYMFELMLSPDGSVVGVVLCDQVKSIDWRHRDVKFITRVSELVIDAVCLKIAKLLHLRIE